MINGLRGCSGRLKKAGAVLTVSTFLFSTFGASWAQANLWQERRKTLQTNASAISLAQLPQGSELQQALPPPVVRNNFLTSSMDTAEAVASASDIKPLLGQLPSWVGSLPSIYGDIQKIHIAHAAATRPLVVLVQDAHDVYSAQKNIVQLIDHIVAGTTSSVLIGLEGAAGGFRVKRFRTSIDPGVLDKVSADLLERAFISGPERYGLIAAKEPFLWGVETPDLYLANVEAYRKSLPLQEKLRSSLTALKSSLEPLKKRFYDPSLIELDRVFESYQAGEKDMSHFVRFLYSRQPSSYHAPEPSQVSFFLKILEQEESLDFGRVEHERTQLIEALSGRLSHEAVSALIEISLSLRAGRVGYGTYYSFLHRTAEGVGVRLTDYPAFEEYVRYVLATDKIDRFKLFAEVDGLERAVLDSAGKTEEQRQVLRLSRDIDLLSRLAGHEFTPAEWFRYNKRRREIERTPERLASLRRAAGFRDIRTEKLPPEWIAPCEEFYQVAYLRNQAMVTNLLKKMGPVSHGRPLTAVLVAGGFHTLGLQRLLESQDISVITVTPRVDSAEKGKNSLDFFAMNRTPLEKLLLGEKLYLSKPLALTNQPLGRIGVALREAVDRAFGIRAPGRHWDINDVNEYAAKIGWLTEEIRFGLFFSFVGLLLVPVYGWTGWFAVQMAVRLIFIVRHWLSRDSAARKAFGWRQIIYAPTVVSVFSLAAAGLAFWFIPDFFLKIVVVVGIYILAGFLSHGSVDYGVYVKWAVPFLPPSWRRHLPQLPAILSAVDDRSSPTGPPDSMEVIGYTEGHLDHLAIFDDENNIVGHILSEHDSVFKTERVITGALPKKDGDPGFRLRLLSNTNRVLNVGLSELSSVVDGKQTGISMRVDTDQTDVRIVAMAGWIRAVRNMIRALEDPTAEEEIREVGNLIYPVPTFDEATNTWRFFISNRGREDTIMGDHTFVLEIKLPEGVRAELGTYTETIAVEGGRTLELKIPFLQRVYSENREDPVSFQVSFTSDHERRTLLKVDEIFNDSFVETYNALRSNPHRSEEENARLEELEKFVTFSRVLVSDNGLYAASWQFLNVVGRDTILTARMMKEVYRPEILRAAAQSLLNWMSEKGNVHHEIVFWRKPSSGKRLDHAMVDDDMMFPGLLKDLLSVLEPDQIREFLLHKHGFQDEREGQEETNWETMARNLNFAAKKAIPFHKVWSLGGDNVVGRAIRYLIWAIFIRFNWRDATDSMYRAHTSFDLAFWPADAVRAIRSILNNQTVKTMLDGGEISISDDKDGLKELADDPDLATAVAASWREAMNKYFLVKLSAEDVRRRLKRYYEWKRFYDPVGYMEDMEYVWKDERGDVRLDDFLAGRAIPPGLRDGLSYYAIGLDKNGRKIEATHNDGMFPLLFDDEIDDLPFIQALTAPYTIPDQFGGLSNQLNGGGTIMRVTNWRLIDFDPETENYWKAYELFLTPAEKEILSRLGSDASLPAVDLEEKLRFLIEQGRLTPDEAAVIENLHPFRILVGKYHGVPWPHMNGGNEVGIQRQAERLLARIPGTMNLAEKARLSGILEYLLDLWEFLSFPEKNRELRRSIGHEEIVDLRPVLDEEATARKVLETIADLLIRRIRQYGAANTKTVYVVVAGGNNMNRGEDYRITIPEVPGFSKVDVRGYLRERLREAFDGRTFNIHVYNNAIAAAMGEARFQLGDPGTPVVRLRKSGMPVDILEGGWGGGKLSNSPGGWRYKPTMGEFPRPDTNETPLGAWFSEGGIAAAFVESLRRQFDRGQFEAFPKLLYYRNNARRILTRIQAGDEALVHEIVGDINLHMRSNPHTTRFVERLGKELADAVLALPEVLLRGHFISFFMSRGVGIGITRVKQDGPSTIILTTEFGKRFGRDANGDLFLASAQRELTRMAALSGRSGVAGIKFQRSVMDHHHYFSGFAPDRPDVSAVGVYIGSEIWLEMLDNGFKDHVNAMLAEGITECESYVATRTSWRKILRGVDVVPYGQNKPIVSSFMQLWNVVRALVDAAKREGYELMDHWVAVRREQRASGTWSGPDRFGIFGGLAFLTVQMGNLSFAAGFFSLLAAVTIVSLILIWAARMSIRGKSTLRREVDSYRDLLEAIPSPEPIRFPSPRQVSNDLLMQGAVLSSKGERAPPLESYGRLGRFVIRFLQKWVRFTKLETAGLADGPVIFNTVGMEHKDYETYLSTIRSGVEAGMPYAVLLVDELNKAELERAIATFVPIELQGRIFIIPSSAYARISESGQDKILYFNQDALLNELAASHEDVTPSRIVSPIPVLLLGKNDLEIVLWIKGWLFPIVQNKVSGWIKTLEAIRRGIDSSA